MIIVINGPLGIGKSTLAEALMERIESCVMLNGDALLAVNPAPADEREFLHSTLELLVDRHRQAGYRHVVIDHFWRSGEDLDDLRQRLDVIETEFRCFLLTLPHDENLRRIARRQQARALDEREFELRTVAEERLALADHGGRLGEPFDVSSPPEELVDRLLRQLGGSLR